MNVQAILRSKGRSVVTIHPDASVERAIAVLRRRGIGALVVSEDGERVVGILSERDLVEAMGRYGGELLGVSVAEVMSCPVVTCAPDDSVADLMAEMTSRRMRHFPVMQDGRLCGIVSIGDLVKSRLDEIEYEAHSMRSFIAGAA
ncbi:MAG: CBS domain-containing protein [Alphaproteobacteria bacterium]|nr:CBS domain-containing protein [Alphaproteobacteria bacterium]